MIVVVLSVRSVPDFTALRELVKSKKYGELTSEQSKFLWNTASKVLMETLEEDRLPTAVFL